MILIFHTVYLVNKPFHNFKRLAGFPWFNSEVDYDATVHLAFSDFPCWLSGIRPY